MDGASCGNWNSPLASVLTMSCALVAVFVSVIFTPGIKAPEGSFTKPATLPVGEASSQPAHNTDSTAGMVHLDIRILIGLLTS